MNRAFFIVIAPALLVAAAYFGIYYGHIVPRWLAFAVAGASVVALLIRAIARRKTGHGSAHEGNLSRLPK